MAQDLEWLIVLRLKRDTARLVAEYLADRGE